MLTSTGLAGRLGFAVVGALLGTQTGRNIEITNSFEFALNEETLEVDHTFFTTRRDQCKQSPFHLYPPFQDQEILIPALQQLSKSFPPTKSSAGTRPAPSLPMRTCASTSNSSSTTRTRSSSSSPPTPTAAKTCP